MMLNPLLRRPLAPILPHVLPLAALSQTFASLPNPKIEEPASPPKRKTRRRKESIETIPTLSDFMHASKVRKQYRSFVRLASFLDGAGTGECRAALEEVRLAYRQGIKKSTDSLSRNMAYSEGERRLKELQSIVGYVPQKSTQQSNPSKADESYESDSWINIKDEEDPRGRVGVQWPWERDDK